MQIFSFKKTCLLVVFICAVSVKGFGQVRPDTTEVTKTMTEFLQVFSNLEWNRFVSFFAPDATAFFPPSAEFPLRANNRVEIEGVFKPFFEKIRKQKTAPPYLSIIPKELKVQSFDSFAIVTFMLDDPNLLGRRTLVLKRTKEGWRIIHLHASGVMLSK